jgi:hypothetical protein
MNHFTTPDFWYCYRHLPEEVRGLADKNFALLRQDPHHPSLRLKKVGAFLVGARRHRRPLVNR